MKRLVWFCLVVVMAGCAGVPPAEKSAAPPPAGEAGHAVTPAGDELLFIEAVAALTSGQQPEANGVRSLLVDLRARYPQSRLRPAAEAMLALIDAGEARGAALAREKLRQEELRRDYERLGREVEQLKRKMKELVESHSAEMAALVQENERLKADLERLKALDIELEKRKFR